MQTTPLMKQYYKIKRDNPDSILLFRMGDFYETFEEDAKTAARVLGITLTKRSNGAAGEVPLAGFPHHAIESYLPKLVRAGYRVAICEQIEDPKKAKGIVKRDVIEVVTPGVAFSDKLLDNKKNNYLLAVCIKDTVAGISFCDISTGEFYTYEVNAASIKQQFERIAPAEILVQKKQKEFIQQTAADIDPVIKVTKRDDWIFNFDYAEELLLMHFGTETLKGYGIEHLEAGVIAAGAVLNYLQETQKANLTHLSQIAVYNPSDYMTLDFATRRNLEITFSMADGGRVGSLIDILDKTETPMGARLLKKWITAPLIKSEPIIARQRSVEELVQKKDLRSRLKEELSGIGDLERLISRICTGRANPREIVALKAALKKLPIIKKLLANIEYATLKQINENLKPINELTEKIEAAVVDTPPLNIADGSVIRHGFSAELDDLRDIAVNGKSWLAGYQKSERERTGINSLKVNFNKVFGYYIDISNTHKDKVPQEYIRKQTLVNSERYITPELKEYEEKLLSAEEKIYDLETVLFTEIRNFASSFTDAIQNNARLTAMLDCFVSFAECAVEYNYVKPEILESGLLRIIEGRHPVVERILPPGEKFTPNTCVLDNDDTQIVILTGPNMSGKSVYLRQQGLIVLLAQIGSFVPAKEAEIGIVDRIFTRVGASDNISAGESTFLVEMQEAANILNNATPKSLLLLDEIGRGTSTYDGISIAWAITEYLHENPNVAAKTLFATHYHELNELAKIFPRIKNYKVSVREYDDKVIFLHKVSKGHADHSYGIQVAQMAGLPKYVTDRGKEILKNLEEKEVTPLDERQKKAAKRQQVDDLQFSLFEFSDDRIRKEVSELEINNLTPIEALNKLHELKKKASE